jgi:hypothetical protein
MSDRTRSPFPGMDPWLESHWGDVHHELISKLADQIAPLLPPDLFVRVQERVYVLDDVGTGDRRTPQQWVPDAGLFRFDRRTPAAPPDSGVSAVAEPIRVSVPIVEPVTEGYIEVRRLRGDRPLVSAVEVFSPTNKSTRQGRAEYLRERADYVAGRVNLMEVDLLRGGHHLIGVPRAAVRAAATAYRVAVRRGGADEVELYPVALRERLPRVRLPLGPGPSQSVVLDLQLPIDHVYKRGRYDAEIDYARPPDPPLSPDDAAWAAERIAAAAGRGPSGGV